MGWRMVLRGGWVHVVEQGVVGMVECGVMDREHAQPQARPYRAGWTVPPASNRTRTRRRAQPEEGLKPGGKARAGRPRPRSKMSYAQASTTLEHPFPPPRHTYLDDVCARPRARARSHAGRRSTRLGRERVRPGAPLPPSYGKWRAAFWLVAGGGAFRRCSWDSSEVRHA